MKKVIFVILGIVLLVLIGSAVYLKFALPNTGDAPKLLIHTDSAEIARGKYLAMHVAVCMDCHSSRDWNKFSAPIVPGTIGKGGEYFGPEMGFPGKFYSRNLTPFNLKNWTDGEIFRAITTGVDKEGKALFPVMPYLYYGKMDKRDVEAIIAYLRTLQPVHYTPPPSKTNFPMNFIINTIPQKATGSERPASSDTIEYGAYLTNMAGCIECHTQTENGKIIPKMAFSGGRVFKMPNGILLSANITPDKETGIGKWSEADFIALFKHYGDSGATYQLNPNQLNTIMPWAMYSGMDSADLKAIYRYLRTVTPIRNQVSAFRLNARE